MFTQLLSYGDIGLLLLRIAVAIVFIYHGLPKLTKSKIMSQSMGTPALMVFTLGVVEVVSAVCLVIGFYTQFYALLLIIVMVGAISMKMTKWHVPFSAMDKVGWEFDFILLAANVAILFTGGGLIHL